MGLVLTILNIALIVGLGQNAHVLASSLRVTVS